LRLEDIPADVRVLARAQTLSMLGAVHAGLRHPVGERLWTAFREEAGSLLQLAAMAGMALDYDETAFAGHLGHSTALVPLALGVDGRTVLRAQVAADEVAARVTAALTLGRSRGQAAGYTHLVGAAVAAGVCMGLTPAQLTMAASLALSQPSRTLYPGFMGSDAKLNVAAQPIATALTSVSQAQAGWRGLPSILEAHGGLLEELAAVPLPEAMSAYGERWHLRTLSIKTVPGCAYISAAVDAAMELAPQLEGTPLDEAEVEVDCSVFTIGMEAESAPFMRGPDSPLAALNFSLGYSVATALMTGRLEVEDFARDRLREPARWSLAGRVRPRHDSALTLRALTATAPIGAALAWAGERARPYLERSGAGVQQIDAVLEAAAHRAPEHFTRPTKEVGARVRVTLPGGQSYEADRTAARGSCGESVEARLALAEEKYKRESGIAASIDIEALDAASISEIWARVGRRA
jgi:hypothetical protein